MRLFKSPARYLFVPGLICVRFYLRPFGTPATGTTRSLLADAAAVACYLLIVLLVVSDLRARRASGRSTE